MAGRTARQYICALNVIALDEIASFGDFLCARVLRTPLHVKNLFARANELFGIAMTLQTPLHLQRRHLMDKRHLINSAMTS